MQSLSKHEKLKIASAKSYPSNESAVQTFSTYSKALLAILRQAQHDTHPCEQNIKIALAKSSPI